MFTLKSILALSLITVAAAANANLVFNGSFETNTNVGGNGGADDRPDGWLNFNDFNTQSSPDVWDNAGEDGLAPGSFGFFTHILAYDGTNMVSIASDGPNFSEGLESSAMALSSNATYRLTVRMAYDSHNGSGYNNPAPLTVRLRQGNGASSVLDVFAAPTADHAWELRTADFVVGSTDSYTLILGSESTTIKNYFVIDDVSVVDLVPEPASVAALGLGTLALLRRRRKA
ncbi:MAG: PEP-CTERM sorting domain-containing protein [Armatimonadetes bacterium]|nr:PEP-CTERM sorting domain-containing protein [Armatimonadota bacterium]